MVLKKTSQWVFLIIVKNHGSTGRVAAHINISLSNDIRQDKLWKYPIKELMLFDDLPQVERCDNLFFNESKGSPQNQPPYNSEWACEDCAIHTKDIDTDLLTLMKSSYNILK